MRKLVISALLLGTSVCQAVTIGAQANNNGTVIEQRSVQPKKPVAPVKPRITPIKKATPTTTKTIEVKHYHHYHHYYHYPTKPVNTRTVRRKVYHHAPKQPVRIQSYRYYQPRVAYSAPMPGAGLRFVIR